MKIRDIRHIAVPLKGDITNAVVNFASHDVSLVAIVSDVVRQGRPVVGFGFNSIGRFAQPGILDRRLIPRLLEASPEALLSESGFDPQKVRDVAMQNEKPGGHGDRAGAVAALELAAFCIDAIDPIY